MINWALSCPFGRMLCIVAVVGVVGYLVVRGLRGSRISAIGAGDSGGCAAAIYAGLHLTYGALYPGCIVHLEDVTGRIFELAAIRVLPLDGPQPPLDFSFCDFHRFHILIGGIITAIAAIGGYWRYCTERDEQPEAILHAEPAVPAHAPAAPHVGPEGRKPQPAKQGPHQMGKKKRGKKRGR
jgi:hypothetical protein